MLFLTSCASRNQHVQPLAKLPKPTTTSTSAMETNIAELEKSVKSASSRAERIKLLIDAIE